ncbi:MAG: carboxymuconolactone decarboxylase family protein [Candidatus Nanohaloarchaea archaeon]|nr:carboxymuconolactone decarboxylase family protein [Candidatus Nanohaloarchaea archaeon]
MTEQTWIAERLGDQAETHEAFEDAVFAEGTLDAKEKRLCAVAAANMARDRGGLQEQIEKAKEAGADEDDLAGALSMAWMTAGSTQIYWAQDVFEEQIEHAWYKRRLGEASKAFGEFHDAIMEDGPLPEVFMELLGVVVGCMGRCEHCVEAHIQQALDKGATKDQVAEALGVVWYIGGRSQVTWLEDRLDELLTG